MHIYAHTYSIRIHTVVGIYVSIMYVDAHTLVPAGAVCMEGAHT